MYGHETPVVALAPTDFARLRTGDWIDIRDDGSILVETSEVAR